MISDMIREPTMNPLRCIGHRGAMGHAPENTLASIRKALALGVHAIEIDVYRIEDQLLVFHDDRLERTTNGSGYLWDHSFAELRQLDAGGGERIPTLPEVLETLNQQVGINIELKGPGTAYPVAECIAQYRRQGWSNQLFLVSSFNHRLLAEVRLQDPEIKLGALLVGLPVDDAAFAQCLGAYSVHVAHDCIDARFVDDAHARGLQVFVFTVNEPYDILAMQALGVDGVFTNFPERVLSQTVTHAFPAGWE